MDASFLDGLACRLQYDLKCAVLQILPRSDWRVPSPWCAGRQKSGLAGPSSDVDFLVVVPVEIAAKSNDIRAALAGILKDKGVKRNGLRDMKDLET